MESIIRIFFSARPSPPNSIEDGYEDAESNYPTTCITSHRKNSCKSRQDAGLLHTCRKLKKKQKTQLLKGERENNNCHFPPQTTIQTL